MSDLCPVCRGSLVRTGYQGCRCTFDDLLPDAQAKPRTLPAPPEERAELLRLVAQNRHRPSLGTLVDRARVEYARSYKTARGRTDLDSEAWQNLCLADPDILDWPRPLQAERLYLARWCEQGFPRIVIGPQRAASLMATGITSEQMGAVILPWKAFLIEIQDGPILIQDPAVPEHVGPIDRVEVHASTISMRTAHAWTMLSWTTYGTGIQRYNVPPEEWLSDDVEPTAAFVLDLDDTDRRAVGLLSRLVAGLCLSLSDEAFRAAARTRAASKSYKLARRGPQVIQDYVLGDDVRIDVRDAISEYMERGGRAPKVQSLVRGHWRSQPHGERGSLRKWVQIQPYWRGPEDAPVVLRKHVMEETERE